MGCTMRYLFGIVTGAALIFAGTAKADCSREDLKAVATQQPVMTAMLVCGQNPLALQPAKYQIPARRSDEATFVALMVLMQAEVLRQRQKP